MRKWLLALVCALLATPALAQITPTYTFTAGTIISPDEVNSNFALLQNALNRTGGTMTGTLNARTILPVTTDTFDVGAVGTKFRHAWFSGNLTVDGTISGTIAGGATSLNCTGCVGPGELAQTGVTAATYGNPTTFTAFNVDADGRILAAAAVTPQLTLTSTYFSSLSGAALTNLDASAISAGTLADARLTTNIPKLNATTNTFGGALNYSTTGVMSWNTRLLATTYAAASDGFLLVNMHDSDGSSILEIRSDGSATPTTVRAKAQVLNTTEPYVSFLSPIKKGDNYRVEATLNSGGLTTSIAWIPLGTGG